VNANGNKRLKTNQAHKELKDGRTRACVKVFSFLSLKGARLSEGNRKQIDCTGTGTVSANAMPSIGSFDDCAARFCCNTHWLYAPDFIHFISPTGGSGPTGINGK
jgi:hypothetical protein